VRDRNEKVDEEGRRFEMWRDVEEQRKGNQFKCNCRCQEDKWNKVIEAQAFEM
jgi:hypothetical protein